MAAPLSSISDIMGEKSFLRRFKYGKPVVSPSYGTAEFDCKGVDCCNIVQQNKMFLMFYVGWDGEKNRIGMAESIDLINWKKTGLCLDSGKKGDWDFGSVSGPFVFRDGDKYLMFYCGFPVRGYETGVHSIGIAESKDLRKWKKRSEPVLTPQEGEWWEKGGLYKSFVLRQDQYYIFYNAKDVSNREYIGMATSKDLKKWQRYPGNPVLRPGRMGTWDSVLIGDPYLIPMGRKWYMFYVGYNGKNAYDGVAVSADLYNWEKHPDSPVVRPSENDSFDGLMAHKPCLIMHNGVWYHFYTGRPKNWLRDKFVDGHISFATNKPIKTTRR